MIIADGLTTAILPCNDIDAAEAFFAPLGFKRPVEDTGEHHDYRLLTNTRGGMIHLTTAVKDWLVAGRNPFGLYIYAEDVDAAAEPVRHLIIGEVKGPEHKPWGMYEFALNGPDDTLVRVGWPNRLRGGS